jgi:uncharacterized tellurite resistance protein B-like protein
MRSYPDNSPQAAARIVALTVLADGDIGESEIELLDRLAVHEQLGLKRHEMHALLDVFCEDLLSSEQLKWADACPVDERTLAELMGEIQDAALRLKLLRLCVELAEADTHVAEGESIVLAAAVEHWGLHYGMNAKPPATAAQRFTARTRRPAR